MKSILAFVLILFIGVIANAQNSKFNVKIVDLTNAAKSAALEACGTAVHTEGKKPLLVTLTHDQSKYTTVTDKNGNWCVLFKRWTNSGAILVEASTMDLSESSGTISR